MKDKREKDKNRNQQNGIEGVERERGEREREGLLELLEDRDTARKGKDGVTEGQEKVLGEWKGKGKRKAESLQEREGMMNEMNTEGDKPNLKEVNQNQMSESQAKIEASRTRGIGNWKRAIDMLIKEKM